MSIFKKKEKEPIVLTPNDNPILKKLFEQSDPCPDVLIGTGLCACIRCPHRKAGKPCAVENMARSAGCVHSYPIACSKRNVLTGGEKYVGDLLAKDIAQKVADKYNIDIGAGSKDAPKEDKKIIIVER